MKKSLVSPIAYLDSSVLLRHAIQHPLALRDIDFASFDLLSSTLTKIECLRTLDRWRITKEINDATLVQSRLTLLEFFDVIQFVPIEETIVERASASFPIALKSLDAVHLTSALVVQAQIGRSILMLTHDVKLAMAATSMGLEVAGL